MSDQPGDVFLSNCLLFIRALRQAGLPIGLDQALAFAQALEWIDLGARGICCCCRSSDSPGARQKRLKIASNKRRCSWRHTSSERAVWYT